MAIRKERCGNFRIIRYYETYCHTLEHFIKLISEAKKDYPELKDSDINIVQYAGDTDARKWGIEFNVKNLGDETNYKEIKYMDQTF